MNNFDAKREGEETNRVTLENLLRLKRHERPLSEFWEDFDVELKERTLQSVVRKKHGLLLSRHASSTLGPFAFLHLQ